MDLIDRILQKEFAVGDVVAVIYMPTKKWRIGSVTEVIKTPFHWQRGTPQEEIIMHTNLVVDLFTTPLEQAEIRHQEECNQEGECTRVYAGAHETKLIGYGWNKPPYIDVPRVTIGDILNVPAR